MISTRATEWGRDENPGPFSWSANINMPVNSALYRPITTFNMVPEASTRPTQTGHAQLNQPIALSIIKGFLDEIVQRS